MFDPNTLYTLFKARERDLFAKAREVRLSEAAKDARSFNGAPANNRMTRVLMISSIWFLVSSCLRLK